MPNILPGAIWQPISVPGRAARRKGRGLVGHVAVSGSKNLTPGPNADWHLYLPKVGPAIQYIDLDLQCWASAAGNASLVAFESEGGLGTSAQLNAEPWTDNQLNWAARILRYLHDTEGVPLEVMPDSLPSSRGFGTHRLGIDPWRVPGGEVWSSARGKECPGNAKVAQAAEIVRRAIAGVGEDDMTPDEHDALMYLKGLVMWALDPTMGKGPAFSTSGQITNDVGAIRGAVSALLARDPKVDIDAADIAAAIPADLARQVADELGKRLNS